MGVVGVNPPRIWHLPATEVAQIPLAKPHGPDNLVPRMGAHSPRGFGPRGGSTSVMLARLSREFRSCRERSHSAQHWGVGSMSRFTFAWLSRGLSLLASRGQRMHGDVAHPRVLLGFLIAYVFGVMALGSIGLLARRAAGIFRLRHIIIILVIIPPIS